MCNDIMTYLFDICQYCNPSVMAFDNLNVSPAVISSLGHNAMATLSHPQLSLYGAEMKLKFSMRV